MATCPWVAESGGGRRESNPDHPVRSGNPQPPARPPRTGELWSRTVGALRELHPPGCPAPAMPCGDAVVPATGRRRIPPPASVPSLPFRRGVGSVHAPAHRSVDRVRQLAPSPGKRTRAPKGPADRVERSSPALRNPAGPPRLERVTSQTGVPPPRTGQNEMKPSWACSSYAGPPGVSAHICDCQGAGSASSPPAGHGETPRPGPVFHRAGVCRRGRTTGPPTGRRRCRDRYTVGRLATPVLWRTPSRPLVSDSIWPADPGGSAQKKAPSDM